MCGARDLSWVVGEAILKWLRNLASPILIFYLRSIIFRFRREVQLEVQHRELRNLATLVAAGEVTNQRRYVLSQVLHRVIARLVGLNQRARNLQFDQLIRYQKLFGDLCRLHADKPGLVLMRE